MTTGNEGRRLGRESVGCSPLSLLFLLFVSRVISQLLETKAGCNAYRLGCNMMHASHPSLPSTSKHGLVPPMPFPLI